MKDGLYRKVHFILKIFEVGFLTFRGKILYIVVSNEGLRGTLQCLILALIEDFSYQYAGERWKY